jgi:hypothetical protein
LARAHAELGQFDEAWRCIGEAMTAVEATKERWCEAEVHRVAGEIALMSPESDAAKAEACFERALAVARQQQAKSWELRAAMSLARLWRDQGKRQEAHDLLAPVYGWFTEGFDTLDLKEARALLEELQPDSRFRNGLLASRSPSSSETISCKNRLAIGSVVSRSNIRYRMSLSRSSARLSSLSVIVRNSLFQKH